MNSIIQCGTCQNITEFVIYACRSLGIPCNLDFTPLRSDANAAHFWIAYYDKEKDLYVQDFLGEIEPVQKSHIIKAIHPLKAYRLRDSFLSFPNNWSKVLNNNLRRLIVAIVIGNYSKARFVLSFFHRMFAITALVCGHHN
ncbi:hypothetical protein FACS189413_17100 [Bacteroidia bacterium]|nr:hypothetical protein FACS189413_17100 [Bacteroidia bacterium]